MYKIFISADENIEEVKQKIQSKIEKYKTDQASQLVYGGPGPVADYDIMAIVNEHKSEFQIIIKEEPIIEEPIQDPLIES